MSRTYDYRGLTFDAIVELAESILKQNGVNPSRETLKAWVNEAMSQVAIDVQSPIDFQKATFPTTYTFFDFPENCMVLQKLFADDVEFVYLPFNVFKQRYGDDI